MSAYKTLTTNNATISSTLTFPNRITTSNLPTGGANQVLITNGAGTPSYGLVPSASIAGGTSNQTLWFNSALGITQWQSRSWRSNSNNVFPTNGEDWNLAASNILNFTRSITAFGVFGPGPYTGLNYINTTTIVCGTTAQYKFDASVTLTNTGLLPVSIKLNVAINGVASGSGIIATFAPGEYKTIAGTMTLNITGAQNIGFITTRLSGTDPLICDSNNSSIMITLMNVLA